MSEIIIGPDGFIFSTPQTQENQTNLDILVKKTLDELEKLLQLQKSITIKNKQKLLDIIRDLGI